MKDKIISWKQKGYLETLLDALWKHKKGIDSYNDVKVQSKAQEEFECVPIKAT